jgi:hypothetical protein
VCFGSGQGGNYCVKPLWLGRVAPGAGAVNGGSSCSNGSQCRSGLCTGGTCADTCCSLTDSAQCSGEQCTFGAFPGATSLDTHFTARCGPPRGLYGYEASCAGDDQCIGGLCSPDPTGTGSYCTNACRSSDDCAPGATCLLDERGTDIYFACFPSSGLAQGAKCSTNDQCLGAWCGTGNQCSNICFTDAQCIQGWRCTPQPDVLATGTYLVLGCGP